MLQSRAAGTWWSWESNPTYGCRKAVVFCGRAEKTEEWGAEKEEQGELMEKDEEEEEMEPEERRERQVEEETEESGVKAEAKEGAEHK